jgi:plasmid stabilization system protein ParE
LQSAFGYSHSIRKIGRRRDHDLRPGLRSFPAGQYVIVNRIEAEDVVILHVLGGSRDLAGQFEN